MKSGSRTLDHGMSGIRARDRASLKMILRKPAPPGGCRWEVDDDDVHIAHQSVYLLISGVKIEAISSEEGEISSRPRVGLPPPTVTRFPVLL